MMMMLLNFGVAQIAESRPPLAIAAMRLYGKL